MSRAFLVGGFGASEEMLEPVGEALSNHFEEVDTMTLQYAEGSPVAVEIMARGAELFALSGSIGVTEHARPTALHGLDVAVRRSATGLVLRTALKQWRMHMDDHPKAKEFETGCRREIFADLGFHIGERTEYLNGR